MSLPIPTCLIAKAARKEGRAEERLFERLKINSAAGGCSLWPCNCKPPCNMETTEEQMTILFVKLWAEDEPSAQLLYNLLT